MGGAYCETPDEHLSDDRCMLARESARSHVPGFVAGQQRRKTGQRVNYLLIVVLGFRCRILVSDQAFAELAYTLAEFSGDLADAPSSEQQDDDEEDSEGTRASRTVITMLLTPVCSIKSNCWNAR